MFKRIKKEGKTKILVFTTSKKGRSTSPGAISHTIGSNSVMIQSSEATWGAIPISGRKRLKLLRDALIKICRRQGIE